MTAVGGDKQMLFEPLALGPLNLANRIVMAPLTRSRAKNDGTPRPFFTEYYAQRADAGLIIVEATNVSAEGKGYAWTPGLFAPEHVTAWRSVTDAVHAAGGRLFVQLMHGGRISHPDLQEDGRQPVAPSAVKANAQSFTPHGKVDTPEPRALRGDEMGRVIEDFRNATSRAKQAGFDGIEVHAANGYLLDQFLRDGTNRRTDKWGGAIANRMRLPLAVVDAVTEIWSADRVGVRISPLSDHADMHDSDPQAIFTAFASELGSRGLAYLHVVEARTTINREAASFDTDVLKPAFDGVIVGNSGYDRALAEQRLAARRINLVAFGRPFISNPDLVSRLRSGTLLQSWDEATFYGGGREGYTGYAEASKNAV